MFACVVCGMSFRPGSKTHTMFTMKDAVGHAMAIKIAGMMVAIEIMLGCGEWWWRW